MAEPVGTHRPQSTDWPLLCTVSLGSALSAMTASVINVALPDIARDFGIGPARAAWVVLAFLLTVTALLLLAGRLGDVVGAGRVYLTGFGVFGFASLGAALAPSLEWLVAARVAQGIGASMAMASAPALVMHAVSPHRRGLALGLMSSAVYIGLMMGPPLGGELVRWLGWRSVFGAMVLVATITSLVAARTVPLGRAQRRAQRFDPVGSLLIAGGTLSFLLVSTRGPAWGWSHPATLALLAVTIMALPGFVVHELRHPSPTLDPRLFRSLAFSAAVLATILSCVAVAVAIYLLPFALRDGQGMEASIVGRVLAGQAAGMALPALGSGWLSDRLGARGLATAGMLITTAGMLGFSLSWPSSGMLAPMGWLFVCGTGIGVFVAPNASALMGAAPADKQGCAGGVLALARVLGMALGVGLASGLFATVFPHGRVEGRWSAAADDIVKLGLGLGFASALGAALVSFVGHAKRVRLSEQG
jgi:EmrB/QacA subfamily drug resistance transporter